MKDCDENQCAAGGAYGAGPCGKNMDCKNKCQGYECVCISEYIPGNFENFIYFVYPDFKKFENIDLRQLHFKTNIILRQINLRQFF